MQLDRFSLETELSSKMPSINTLLIHHISENHLPTARDVMRKEIILLILGLGGLNYVPVAYYNGKTVTMSVINAVTTALLGEIILYISGKIYYDIKIEPQYIAEELKDVIQAPLTNKNFIQEVLLQVVFAAGSAVPLATTLFEADLPIFQENPWLFWLAFSYIEIVNTAMHLVPIELTMRDPFYSFPLRFLSWLISFLPASLLKACSAIPAYIFDQVFYCYQHLAGYSLVEDNIISDQSLLDRRAIACGNIVPILTNAKRNFFHKLINQAPEKIQTDVERYEASPSLLLQDMLACYTATQPINPVAHTMARIVGGSLVASACLGYAANPYLVFKNDFHFSVQHAIEITILPIYFFMVLMTFFGDCNGVRALQDILSLRNACYQSNVIYEKLPKMAKLYPFAFAFIATSILFFVGFAGAPGRQMMKSAFAEIFPAWLMIVMMGVVDLGIGGLLTLYVSLDFAKIMMNHYAQYCGAEPQKNLAILNAKIEALIRDFGRIKPDAVDELEEFASFLPSQSEPAQAISFHQSRSCCDGWCNFMQSKQSADENDVEKNLLPGILSGVRT